MLLPAWLRVYLQLTIRQRWVEVSLVELGERTLPLLISNGNAFPGSLQGSWARIPTGMRGEGLGNPGGAGRGLRTPGARGLCVMAWIRAALWEAQVQT